MKKMKTLFEREFENHNVIKCLDKVQEGCEWVLAGEGTATEKFDGTCCMINDGRMYRRYDYKKGRTLPEGAIPCQEEADPVTGHWPHWIECKEDNPADKYHIQAFKKLIVNENGTYELIGKHEQGNPYHLDDDILIRHGNRVLDVPRTYNGIKQYLKEHEIEGIVFYRGNGEMCKIKRTDFGFHWNRK